jgi:hypothetical protein
MLVPPRRVRDGDLTGCTGATMEDGTVYNANRYGHMEVASEAHAKAMVKNPAAPGHVIEAKFSGAGLSGASCTTCGFGAFKWQCSAPCPRCGGEIKEETT